MYSGRGSRTGSMNIYDTPANPLGGVPEGGGIAHNSLRPEQQEQCSWV